MASTTYPRLFQVFGGHFHQDWRYQYDTPAEAVDDFRSELSDGERAATLIKLESLLAECTDEASIASRLSQLGCAYVPKADGWKYADWLHWIGEKLRHRRGAGFVS